MDADARYHVVSYDTRRRLRPPPSGLSSGCPILSPREVLRGPSSLCMGSAQLPSGEPVLQSAGISLPVCAEAGLPFHRTIQPRPAALCFCSRKQQAERAWSLSVSATSAPFTLLLEICRGSLLHMKRKDWRHHSVPVPCRYGAGIGWWPNFLVWCACGSGSVPACRA